MVDACGMGPLHALFVQCQRTVDDSGFPAHAAADLLGIGQLRNPFGVHKRGNLYLPNSCLRQCVDGLDLEVGGYRFALDLKSISSGDFDKSYCIRKIHGLMQVLKHAPTDRSSRVRSDRGSSVEAADPLPYPC